MKVLGIETSCDETAAAVVCDAVAPEKRILSNIVNSQVSLHATYGGVVPEIAARCHVDAIDEVINGALEEAGCTINDIDIIAATACPGLIGGLLVGSVCAKTISAVTGKPYMAINHLEGHLLTCRLCYDVEFPFLLLLTSGGNFLFAEVLGIGKYKILGETLDDAAGECFDKVAKMLGFSYPGGVAIQKHAEHGDPERYKFTIPLQRRRGCDVSFSGLKTAVKLQIETLGCLTEQDKCDISASFQNTAVKFIIKQLGKAFEITTSTPKSIVVAGGVAANTALRKALMDFASQHNLKFFAPPISLCTDNGAMIAWTAIERRRANFPFSPLDTKTSPRQSITEM